MIYSNSAGSALGSALGAIMDWGQGVGTMATMLMAGIVLSCGMIVLLMAVRARGSVARGRGRVRTAAILVALWAGIALSGPLISSVTGFADTETGNLTAAGQISVLFLAASLLLASLALFSTLRRRDGTRYWRRSSISTDDLWVSIARSISGAPTLDAMLMEVAAAVRGALCASAAHVYKIDPVTSGARRVGTATGDMPTETAGRLSTGAILAESASACAAENDVWISDGHPLALGLPMGVDGEVYAVMLFENPVAGVMRDRSRQTLRGIGALVGRAIHDWGLALKGTTSGRLCDTLPDVLDVLLKEDRLERGLPTIAEGLAGVMDIDYISLAWLDRARRHETRASMAVGEDRIVENRRHWPISESTRRSLVLRRGMITPDLKMAAVEGQERDEAWECRLGMRSRLVIPLMAGSDLIGTLTVAHRLPAMYGEEEMKLTVVVGGIVTLWLRGLSAQRSLQRMRQAEEFVESLRDAQSRPLDEPRLLREALEYLDVSGLRLFRMQHGTGDLLEVASAGRVAGSNGTRTLALSHLPWHRHAMERGGPLWIDQNDPESTMDRNEAALVMASEFQTGSIVPITWRGKACGFLDLVEMRNPDRKRIDRTDRLVLCAVAEHLARGWQSDRESAPPPTELRDRTQWAEALRDHHRKIVNPITSIIGSVELIRHKQGNLNADAIKYLTTIERAAVSIHESTAKFYKDITSRGTREKEASPARWLSPAAGVSSIDQSGGRPAGFIRPASMRDMRRDPEAAIATGPIPERATRIREATVEAPAR